MRANRDEIFNLDLAHALGTPGARARIRVRAEDFSVEGAPLPEDVTRTPL